MANQYFKFKYGVPPVPERLYHLLLYDVGKLEESDWEGDQSIYSTYHVQEELQTWVQSYFDFPVIVNYQVIDKQVPIHRDVDRILCWNYLIKTGGPKVTTRWWNDDETEVVQSVVFRPHCWYELNVKQKHDVIDVEGHRVAITVWQDPVIGFKEL